MNRNEVYNFGAGPAALPTAVIEQVQAELPNFQGTGMSVMEMSHRGPSYEDIQHQAERLLRELLGIPEDYYVLFLQGAASMQFAMLPMNMLTAGKQGAYVLTGAWAEKAYSEAGRIGTVRVAGSSEQDHFTKIPAASDISVTSDDAYLHITSNETIGGIQWHMFPDMGAVPLVADMSSDILSRGIDVSQFGLIYAGAQKNLGPAGVTVVIVRRNWLDQEANQNTPVILQYATYAKHQSLYNTPPTFVVYVLGLMLQWVSAAGGVTEMERRSKQKAAMLYDAIDSSNGFYRGIAAVESRSQMNVTFALPTTELERLFLTEAVSAGFVGLNGHRSVGGCRASLYNAVPMESCERLRDWMLDFHRMHG